MRFNSNNFYHVFNRGNNKQRLFLGDRNYKFFRKKIVEFLSQHCDIIAYCLMPNHYHLLIYVKSAESTDSGRMQVLERKIGTLQSSYTRAFNLEEHKTGSLFQSKFKSIELDQDHAFSCFHYIHQNPVKAGLATRLDGWAYSSYSEYWANRTEGLCNRKLCVELLPVPNASKLFEKQSTEVIIDEKTLGNLDGG